MVNPATSSKLPYQPCWFDKSIAGEFPAGTDAETRTTDYAYDSRDNRTSSVDNDGGVFSVSYRMDGLVKSSKDESGQVTSYRYDRSARLIEITDGVGNQTTIGYERGNELAGNRIETVVTPNNQVFLDYDARNRVILQNLISVKNDGLVSSTAIRYNARGERTIITDPNGNSTNRTYTPHREIATETNAEGETITYAYDNRGNLTSVTDATDKTTVYAYDDNDNRTSETRPMGEVQSYQYDANNNETEHTDYNGNIAINSYDDDSRRAGLTNTKAGQTIAERSITFSYDKTNLQTGYSDNKSSAVYQYDALGRLEEQTTTFNTDAESISKTLKTGYYKNSQVKTRIDAENNLTTYSYDAAGKLTQIAIQNAGSILLNGYEGNLVNSIAYPGGIQRHQEYDGLARLKRILVQDNADNPKMDYQYGFDDLGNITSKTTQQGEFVYDYDKAYRLTEADQPNSFGEQGYSYDENSNRKTRSDNGTQIGYQYNDNNELTQINKTVTEAVISQVLSYDDNGALVSETEDNGSVKTYHYTSFGRLERVEQGEATIATYAYDPQSRRISKTTDGQTNYFLYDDTGTGLAGEYSETGDLIRAYVYQPNGYFTTDPVAQKTPSSSDPITYTYSYYQNDHLGTPQQLVQTSGATVWKGDYDAFGQVNEVISGTNNPLRFPGQYADTETGLYYNWNRYYAAGLGRYVRSDPIGLNGGVNIFSYAKNGPLDYLDIRGLNVLKNTCKKLAYKGCKKLFGKSCRAKMCRITTVECFACDTSLEKCKREADEKCGDEPDPVPPPPVDPNAPLCESNGCCWTFPKDFFGRPKEPIRKCPDDPVANLPSKGDPNVCPG